MTIFDPRTTDEIYDATEADLTDRIDRLTDFADGSFDQGWVQTYAIQVHEVEVKALAAQLSGFVDFAGNSDITRAQLESLGITNVDPEEINQHMYDQQLDELAKTVGVTRDPGSKATGEVTFEVSSDSVEIYEGYEIGTEPTGSDSSYDSFYVDADGDGTIDQDSTASVSPSSNSTTVTVDVIAKEVGQDKNVGSGAVSYLPSPKAGVKSVSNSASMTGGADVQSNESLREDVKNAVPESSGGGTKSGMIGYIESGASTSVEADVDEYKDQQPPFVDVVVDGGNDAEILELIDESHPLGIQHNLVRPTSIGIGTRIELTGTDIDTSQVNSAIVDYISDVELGGRFSRSTLTGEVLKADDDITSIPAMTTYLTQVAGDLYTYQSGTSVYELNYKQLGAVYDEEHTYRSDTTDYRTTFTGYSASSVEVEAIVDDESVTLVRGSTDDYEVVDDDGDGDNDRVRLTENTIPDSGTALRISYEHTESVVDDVSTDSTTYVKGTDYAVIDNDGDGVDDAIDFSIGGDSPADGERFTVDYRTHRSFRGDLSIVTREKFSADTNFITVSVEN